MILQVSSLDGLGQAVLLLRAQLISAGNSTMSEVSDSASQRWAYCQLGHPGPLNHVPPINIMPQTRHALLT